MHPTLELARRLACCRLAVASFEKRLARQVAALPDDATPSEAQTYYVRIYAHKYRAQLGGCPVESCEACAGRPWPERPAGKRKHRLRADGVDARTKDGRLVEPWQVRKRRWRDEQRLREHNAAFGGPGDAER